MAITCLVKRRSESLALLGLKLITMVVTPFSNFDPINPIKQFILAATSFGLLGLVWISFFTTNSKPRKFTVVFYLISLCALLIFAESQISHQLWGTISWNTGLPTYISTEILITGFAALSSKSLLHRFLRAQYSL